MSSSRISSVPKASSQSSKRYKQHCREIKVEIAIKLLLSSILSIAAIASLVKLLPYHWSQQAKLKELRTQVKETEARVNQLRQELENNFDPQQAQNLMHQYGTQINRTQSRIFWLEDKQD